MRGKRVGGLVVAACLALPAMAQASKLESVHSPAGSGGVPAATTFIYTAASGEANQVTIDRSPNYIGEPLGYFGGVRTNLANVRFGESGALITSVTPLTLISAGIGIASLCSPPLLPSVLCVVQERTVRVVARLGDRDDRITVQSWPAGTGIPGDSVRVEAGAGNDTINGGVQSDIVLGDDGDDHIVLPNDGAVDIVECGAGSDTVTRVGGVDAYDVIRPGCEVVA